MRHTLRHRLLLPVTALGAAALLPLTVAAPASAAESWTTWNELAECESGGNWHINTGNGYYGGVQISQETWDAHDGDDFASRPDLAYKYEQIRVAERILDSQGWGAWPSCSQSTGIA